MANTFSAIKILIVPAIISLVLFLTISFVLVPVWRRYRNRYSQYLPLDTLSSQTFSIWDRIRHRLAGLSLPSWWNRDREVASATGAAGAAGAAGNPEYLGEELSDVDEQTWRTVESGRPDDTGRLSRDLEEVFRDDSSDDEPNR